MRPDRSAQAAQVRILLVDDHAILRKALRGLLDGRSGLTVVGECRDGREAVSETLKLRPDVVLMDLNMPNLNGIEAIRRIKDGAPGTRVIVLSAYGDRERLKEAVAAGAQGYVVKRSDVDELMLAITTVRSGNHYFSADLVDSIDVAEVIYEAKRAANVPGSSSSLTPREREVLQLVAEGHTAKAIARQLTITEKTVEAHKTNIMQKLGAKNRSDLIRYAFRSGIVELEPGLEGAPSPVESQQSSPLSPQP